MKKVESMVVISYSTTLNFEGLKTLVGVVPLEIERVAKDQGFEVNGKQIWAYEGCDGNPATQFGLKICLPIIPTTKLIVHDRFKIETLDEIQVCTAIHKGNWMDMGITYQSLMGGMMAANHFPTGRTREIYDIIDFQNPDNCVTEVQVEYI